MDKIITLQIGITDFCNFRCKMCVQSDVNDFRVNKKGFMAFSTWKGIMDRMQAYGKRFSILLIWIGESFLHPQIADFIRYVYESDSKNLLTSIMVYTNGSMLTPILSKEIIDLTVKHSKRFDIVFSYVSDTPDTARLMNENTDFDLIVKNTREFSDYAIKIAKGKIGINFQYVITKENLHETENFIKRWSEYFKNSCVEFKLIYDYYLESWETHNYKISLMPEGNDNSEKQNENNELFSNFLQKLGVIDKPKTENCDRFYKKEYGKVKCSSPWEFYVVNWNGDVTACCKDFELELKYGNFLKSSFEDISRSAKLVAIKENLLNDDYEEGSLCKHCSGFKGDFSKIYDGDA